MLISSRRAYAIRFVQDRPIVRDLDPVDDLQDINRQNTFGYPDTDIEDYDFEESWQLDPTTNAGKYVLNRHNKHIDQKFGLGLILCVLPI